MPEDVILIGGLASLLPGDPLSLVQASGRWKMVVGGYVVLAAHSGQEDGH